MTLSVADTATAREGSDDSSPEGDSPRPDDQPEDVGADGDTGGTPEDAPDSKSKTKKKKRKKNKTVLPPGVFIYYERFEEFRELEKSFQFPHHAVYKMTQDDKALVPRFQKKRYVLGSYHEDFQRDFYPSKGPMRVLKDNLKYTPQCAITFDEIVPLNKRQDTYQKYLGTPRSTLQNLLCWMANNMPILEELRQCKPGGKKARKSFVNETSTRIRLDHLDFVCSKTVLCRLVEAIHLFAGRIKIYATRFEGTIYLLGTELRKNQKAKIAAWSHRFKDWMCNEEFDLEESPTSTNTVCRTVVTSYVGNYRVLYTVCTDALLPDNEEDYVNEEVVDYSEHKAAFSAYSDVEPQAFKTFDPTKDLSRYTHIRCMQTCKKPEQLEKYKFLYWTHDSIFSSVKNVVAGQRSQKGILSSVTRYTHQHYSNVAAQSWDVGKGFVFLKKFFHFVQKQFENVKDEEILVFERIRGESVVYCRKPTQEEEEQGGQDISGNMEYSNHAIQILPGFWTRRKDRRTGILDSEGF